MTSPPEAKNSGVTSFRIKLLVAMALVVLGITASGLYFAERKVAAETEHDLQRDFQASLASLHGLQEMRHASLAERCRATRAKTAHPRRVGGQCAGSALPKRKGRVARSGGG